MGSAIFVFLFIVAASAVIMRKDEWNDLMEELKTKLGEEKMEHGEEK